MDELREILARESARLAPPPPAFENVLRRAHRRRFAQIGGAAIAVAAALTVTVYAAGLNDANGSARSAASTVQPSSVASNTAKATSGDAVCGDLTVDAVVGNNDAQFKAGQPATLTLDVGQTLALTARGTCAIGVVYVPDNVHIGIAPGQSPQPIFNGGSGGSARTVSFTALMPGVSSIDAVVANMGPPAGGRAPSLSITVVVRGSGPANSAST